MVNIIKKSLLKSQRGGMLVELMLSITIAAIILPFIVRYQQNAISRAKNIAVAKQIEIVQNALERYINQRKNEFLDHVGNHNWKVKISELKEYGLPEHIIDEHGEDYQLSVLKSGSGVNSVLQGVVVLNNKDISSFRSREIANLGNGKYGFVDGDDVYGGFNVFKTSTASLGLDKDIETAVVGTTETTATSGNSMYLWRDSKNPIDSTMRSNLNLNGQNVSGINDLIFSGSFAFFDTLRVGKIGYKFMLSTLEFKNTALLNGISYTTNKLNLINSGNILGDTHNAVVAKRLDINTTGTFGTIEAEDLNVKQDLTLNGINISDTTKFDRVGGTTIVNGVVANTVIIDGAPAVKTSVGSITTDLKVHKKISSGIDVLPGGDPMFFWDLENNTGSFNEIVLRDLNELIQKYCKPGSGYYVSKSIAVKYFCEQLTGKTITVGTAIQHLSNVAQAVTDFYHKQFPKGNGNNNEGRM